MRALEGGGEAVEAQVPDHQKHPVEHHHVGALEARALRLDLTCGTRSGVIEGNGRRPCENVVLGGPARMWFYGLLYSPPVRKSVHPAMTATATM